MSSDWQAEDLVYRQIHPSHAPGGIPSSQAFNPTPKDEGQLSVDDSQIFTAEKSWNHFTTNLGFQSIGTWAISFKEIEAVGDLQLRKDPLENQEDPSKNNPAHCFIDFTSLSSKGQRKKRAQQLAMRAHARGCQFDPSN